MPVERVLQKHEIPTLIDISTRTLQSHGYGKLRGRSGGVLSFEGSGKGSEGKVVLTLKAGELPKVESAGPAGATCHGAASALANRLASAQTIVELRGRLSRDKEYTVYLAHHRE